MRDTHGVGSPLLRSQVFNSPERGWELVEVEAEDIVACQGFLPTRCVGLDGDDQDARIGSATRDTGVASETQEWDAGVEGDGQDGDIGLSGDMDEDAGLAGGVLPVRVPPTDAGAGSSPTKGEEIVTNEPKLDQDVITTQNEENVEVVANSDAFSGLDTLRTNPRAGGGREIPNSKSEGAISKSEGAISKSEGAISKAENRNSKAEGSEAKSESPNLKSEARNSKAEGAISKAEAPNSKSEGSQSKSEARNSKSEGAISKAEARNSNSEARRDAGDIESERHPLVTEQPDGLRRSALAETLTPGLSRGEREGGSEGPAEAFLRANPPPPPGAATHPKGGRNGRDAVRWEAIRQAWIRSRQQQRPEGHEIRRGAEEMRLRAEIDKMLGVGESTGGPMKSGP